MKHTTFNLQVSGCLKDKSSFNLHCDLFTPDEDNVKATAIFSHGWLEYGSRYQDFYNCLTLMGVAVYTIDHYGHGQSSGQHGAIKTTFNDAWINSFYQLHLRAEKDYPGVPRFAIGHSFGGHCALKTAMLHPEIASAGCILSAPCIDMAPEQGSYLLREKIAPALAKIAPNAKLPAFKDKQLTRNTTYLPAETDELMVGRKTRVKTIRKLHETCIELIKMIKENSESVPRTLLFQGTNDTLVDWKLNKSLMEGNENVDFVLVPNAKHEILRELSYEDHYKTIMNWMGARINSNYQK